MRVATTLNGSSKHSILSIDALTRARLSNAKKQQSKSSRLTQRRTIHGALDGILGESMEDDWSVDDKSVQAKNNQNQQEDNISLSSQLSEDNSSQKSNSTGRRYRRRGSVTKYSVEPAVIAATEADKQLSHQSEHDDINTSSVHSSTSQSSFPQTPAQCTTIDSLPLPMKAKSKKSMTSKKSRDSISKYSGHSIKEDVLAASLHKKDSSDEKKNRLSKLKKPDTPATPDSPDTAKDPKKTTKKKKKELKLRKDKPNKEDEAASVSSSKASSKRRHKRRCSVTKYNLPKEVENQMDTSFSGPISLPVADAPASPEVSPETSKHPDSPPSPSSSKRHHRRRTSVTAYTPAVREAANKSPGALSKRPSISSATLKSTAKSSHEMSPGIHRPRRNSITKYSLEESKPHNFPAAA